MISDHGSNVFLERIGCKYGLDKFVIKNPCQGESLSQTTMSSTVEALLGAAWLDSGRNFKQVRAVIEKLEIID